MVSPADNAVTLLNNALLGIRLDKACVTRGPSGEIALWLAREDSDALARILSLDPAMFSMNLRSIGVQPLGGSITATATMLYFTNEGAERLAARILDHLGSSSQ